MVDLHFLQHKADVESSKTPYQISRSAVLVDQH